MRSGCSAATPSRAYGGSRPGPGGQPARSQEAGSAAPRRGSAFTPRASSASVMSRRMASASVSILSANRKSRIRALSSSGMVRIVRCAATAGPPNGAPGAYRTDVGDINSNVAIAHRYRDAPGRRPSQVSTPCPHRASKGVSRNTGLTAGQRRSEPL